MQNFTAAVRADDMTDIFDELCAPAPALETKTATAAAGAFTRAVDEGSKTKAAPAQPDVADATARAVVSIARRLDSIEDAIGEQRRVHEQFKGSNDEAERDRKRRGAADPISEDRSDRMSKVLDALEDVKKRIARSELKAGRPGFGAARAQAQPNPFDIWRKEADLYFRQGGNEAKLREIEQKVARSNTAADGGYLVFPEKEQSILDKLMLEISPMRQLASVRSISTLQYTKPYSLRGAASGWVAEEAARTATATATVAELSYSAFELYANPAATQALLDDAATDIEAWHAGEVADEFSLQENRAFVSGSGTDRPKGFLAYTAVANASWAHGSIGYIATGAAGAFGASPLDNLIDMTNAIKAGFRLNAQFVANRATYGVLRKLKDTTGQYIWEPSATKGRPAQLLGYDAIEAEDMPAIAANSLSVAFGDFKRGYLIVDRMGVRVLRDPYTNKPYVQFYTTKRVGGGVQNFEAIKILKFAVS